MNSNLKLSTAHDGPTVGRWFLLTSNYLTLFLVLAVLLHVGCGTTAKRIALEQLLVSDAVDKAVAKIDFSPLQGKKVFLNTEFIKLIRTRSSINGGYVVGAIRHQLFAAGCQLQKVESTAEIIVEPRVGALGADEYKITYGIPQSDAAASLATIATGSSLSLPAIPEVAIGKLEHRQGVAKLSIFAYRRDNQSAVWQSGVARSTSTSSDTWFLGAGPFQRGSVYDGTRFAGSSLRLRLAGNTSVDPMPVNTDYLHAKVFPPVSDATSSAEPSQIAGKPVSAKLEKR